MKQPADILHNYTVAKIICSVNFHNLTELSEKYKVRYLHKNGKILTLQE